MKLTQIADALSVDAVSSSVDLPLEVLVAELSVALQAEPRTCRPVNGGRGYQHAVELVDPATERRYCMVMYGSAHAKPHVYAQGTEEYDSPATYAALQSRCRDLWTPSRIDVALDFEDDLWFEVIQPELLQIALRRGAEIDQKGDWARGKSRTFYVGSRTSTFYVRLYEYRQHHGYGPAVRLEVEVKAKAKHRAAIAAMHPADLLGACPVVQQLLAKLNVQIPRATLSQGAKPPSTVERDLAYLARQALPAFERVIAALGTEAAALEAVRAYAGETEAIRASIRCRTVSQSEPCVTPTLPTVNAAL